MIMCPAECHCVPTVMVIEQVFFFFLAEGGGCLFFLFSCCSTCQSCRFVVCLELSTKYIMPCIWTPLRLFHNDSTVYRKEWESQPSPTCVTRQLQSQCSLISRRGFLEKLKGAMIWHKRSFGWLIFGPQLSRWSSMKGRKNINRYAGCCEGPGALSFMTSITRRENGPSVTSPLHFNGNQFSYKGTGGNVSLSQAQAQHGLRTPCFRLYVWGNTLPILLLFCLFVVFQKPCVKGETRVNSSIFCYIKIIHFLVSFHYFIQSGAESSWCKVMGLKKTNKHVNLTWKLLTLP